MSAMSIYVWEIRHSTGLARDYAYHQLELYLMVLSQLGKTYWTADLQYNLYMEALKVIKASTSAAEKNPAEPAPHPRSGQYADMQSTGGSEMSQPYGSYINGTLEDYFLTFNPFMGLPMQGDELRYERTFVTPINANFARIAHP